MECNISTAYHLFGYWTEGIRVCVGWISEPPVTEYRTYPIKYLLIN